MLLGMWDLSSQTRGRTHILCVARLILNQWAIREVPGKGKFDPEVRTQGEGHMKTARDKGTPRSWEVGLGYILSTPLILDFRLPDLRRSVSVV